MKLNNLKNLFPSLTPPSSAPESITKITKYVTSWLEHLIPIHQYVDCFHIYLTNILRILCTFLRDMNVCLFQISTHFTKSYKIFTFYILPWHLSMYVTIHLYQIYHNKYICYLQSVYFESYIFYITFLMFIVKLSEKILHVKWQQCFSTGYSFLGVQ